MDVQLLAFTALISSGVTAIPAIPFLVNRGFTISFTRKAFMTNLVGFMIVAFLFEFMAFGSYTLYLFASGCTFIVVGGFYKGLREHGTTKGGATLALGIVLFSGIAFCVLLFTWLFAKDVIYFSPSSPSIFFGLHKIGLVLLFFACFNGLLIAEVHGIRNKRRIMAMVVGAMAFIIFLVSYVGAFDGAISKAVTWEELVAIMQGGQDPFTTLIFETLRDPLIGTTIGIMVFGAILKTLNYWQASIIADVFVFFFPLLIWAMVMVDAIPTPEILEVLYEGFGPLIKISWILIVGILFIIASGMISLFASLNRERIELF